jgi:hypothetical protein
LYKKKKKKRQGRAGDVVQVIENLASMCKVLSSDPNTTKNKDMFRTTGDV